MDTKKTKSLSKFLSLILRHKPQIIGLSLDESGWADTEILLQKMNLAGRVVDLKLLEHVVETNEKKRFAFNGDKSKIRANQGHSIVIDHGFRPKAPPMLLYHGTTDKFLDSILQNGLARKNRHHVHLSEDIETAKNVGQRHGKPVVLKIDAAQMQKEKFLFYQSENGVWLTDAVPPRFLTPLV